MRLFHVLRTLSTPRVGLVYLAVVAIIVMMPAFVFADDGDQFTPLDLQPLFNQPHTNAFPEGPEGFHSWFSHPEFTVDESDDKFVPTPWRAEYAIAAMPKDFPAWADATFFGPQDVTVGHVRRIPFEVKTAGWDVVAFDRNTVPLAKTLTNIQQRATHLHLLACGGWWPQGRPMAVKVTYTDGTVEQDEFRTQEWLEDAAAAAVVFDHGNLFHIEIALQHPDKVISSLTFVDMQKGPQLLIAAATLELRAKQPPVPVPAPAAQTEWQRLEAATVSFDGATIVVDKASDPLVQFAAQELQRYLYRLSGRLLTIAADVPKAGAVIRLQTASALSGEAYRIQAAQDAGRPVLEITGASPASVMYGVYTLLQRFGVGFFLGGDTLPPHSVPLLVPGDLDIQESPAFKIRGSLPWFNFLDSPTTWNYADYKFFIDQMVKQKCNFVGFHTYDYEPFGAYEDAGTLHDGAPLAGSVNYGWGTVKPLPTTEFGFGTADLYDTDNFAADAILVNGDADARIRSCQELLRRALAYAHSKGMKTCLGFEVHGDPTDPQEQHRFAERLRQLVQNYPTLDYVWIWQPESLGARGWSIPAAGSPFSRLARDYFATFAYLGSRERIVEAARITAYARLAHDLLQRFAPNARLVVAGWGGDQWMHFTDFFTGFDKVLPDDVIFAALDNIDPTRQDGVSKRYAGIQHHEVWPIPWFESDGGGTRHDQWGPQCNVKPFSYICRDALKKKTAGLLGIHWRTRGVEEVAAYTAQFAWNPRLSYPEFYYRFAKDCFGAQNAAVGGELLQELEALGPRWTGGGGQVECGQFTWCSGGLLPDDKKLSALDSDSKRVRRICQRFTGMRDDCLKAEDPGPAEQIDHLLNTARFLTLYDQAAVLYRADGPVEAALHAGNTATAAALLAKPFLGEAMQAYARTISSRSELGVLATINVKAYAAYRALEQRAGVKTDPQIVSPGGPPTLLVPVHDTTYDVGEPAELTAIALSAAPVNVRVCYRRLGEPQFATLEMRRTVRSTFRATLPNVTAAAGGFEYYFEARDGQGRTSVMPAGAPAVLYSATVRASASAVPARSVPSAAAEPVLATATPDGLFCAPQPAPTTVKLTPPAVIHATAQGNAVWITWSPVDGAIGYQVYRQAQGETEATCITAACPVAEAHLLDRTVEAERGYSYTVRALTPDLREGPPSPPAKCTAPYTPPAGISVRPEQKVVIDIQCAMRGPEGRVDDFHSFARDKVVLPFRTVDITKEHGYGYCWDADIVGCWADDHAVEFRLTGLTPGARYALYLRCFSFENMDRIQRVLIGGHVAADKWQLPKGRAPADSWRQVDFTADAAAVPVSVENVSGGNAVVSEVVLAAPR